MGAVHSYIDQKKEEHKKQKIQNTQIYNPSPDIFDAPKYCRRSSIIYYDPKIGYHDPSFKAV
jgi:hypothetical protein